MSPYISKTRIFLNGCCGHMGRVIHDICVSTGEAQVVAGADKNVCDVDFPVYPSATDSKEEFDVIVDFSNPSALHSVISLAERTGKPLVICTTGFSDEQISFIQSLSQTCPVFYSGNMSLGINVLIHLVRKAAQVLYPDFDIEIVEQHHRRKVDAPSGTALMIADEINDTLSNKMEYVYDRHDNRKARESTTIGIHSVRGGNIVGEHSVLFAGPEENITISHSASTRNVFARGAVKAAVFMIGKTPGLYTMKDLLG